MQRGAVFVMRTQPRRLGELVEPDPAGGLVGELRTCRWRAIRTMEEVYRASMARSSFTLVMLAIAGGMALLLGVVGIYGVISYSVSQRTRELGIRMALGAPHGTLKAMVVRHGVLLAAIGVAFGLAAAVALTRLMSSLLFEVSPLDPLTYAAVSAGLLLRRPRPATCRRTALPPWIRPKPCAPSRRTPGAYQPRRTNSGTKSKCLSRLSRRSLCCRTRAAIQRSLAGMGARSALVPPWRDRPPSRGNRR